VRLRTPAIFTVMAILLSARIITTNITSITVEAIITSITTRRHKGADW
jgi:hypothetical protein